MKTYKIYCLKDPITLEIRYIGITTLKLKERYAQHKHVALKKEGQTHVAKWFKKIFNTSKLLPIIELIEICNENNWEEREIYWIKYYNNLTNIREGGRGVIVNRDLDSKERSAKAKWKKIIQFDLDGNVVKIWDSIKEATSFLNLKSLSSISNVLNNNKRSKTCKRFYWMYYEDYLKNGFKVRLRKNKITKVYQYDLNYNLIKKWDSISDAANSLDIYSSAIHETLDKITKSGKPAIGKNFIWKTKIIEDIV